MILPTLSQLIDANRLQIELYGGFFVGKDNIKAASVLTSALATLEHGVFGKDPYPSIEEKAAYLMHRIVTGHPFHDGNKRTGLLAARGVADLNGRTLVLASPVDADAIAFIESLAAGEKDYEETLVWVQSRIR